MDNDFSFISEALVIQPLPEYSLWPRQWTLCCHFRFLFWADLFKIAPSQYTRILLEF